MIRRDWKRLRATSLLHALRLCKEFAQAKHNLSVARIADRMGVTEDSLYKWLGNGRMPAILIPTYELACGVHYVTDWLAAGAGRLVVAMPSGKAASTDDLLQLGSEFQQAVQLLGAFYKSDGAADAAPVLDALRAHMERVAHHHANVSAYAEPQLDFDR